jgi:RNA polymerase sigma-70 factor (ECF subfamily)
MAIALAGERQEIKRDRLSYWRIHAARQVAGTGSEFPMGAADRSTERRPPVVEGNPGSAEGILGGPESRGPARLPETEEPAAAGGAGIDDEDRGLSFEQIVAKYEKKIFNLVLRCIGDREEAEDLTQETFLNAYKSFPTFRGECKIHTWLCQIALNQCKNRFRQRDRRRSMEGPSLDAPTSSGEESLRPLEIADWDQSPQDVLIRNETHRYVLRAIDSLPDEYRTVIILCDLQQMSYLQIAQSTGLTLEAVKTRIHRGRLMLRRKLDAYLRG